MIAFRSLFLALCLTVGIVACNTNGSIPSANPAVPTVSPSPSPTPTQAVATPRPAASRSPKPRPTG